MEGRNVGFSRKGSRGPVAHCKVQYRYLPSCRPVLQWSSFRGRGLSPEGRTPRWTCRRPLVDRETHRVPLALPPLVGSSNVSMTKDDTSCVSDTETWLGTLETSLHTYLGRVRWSKGPFSPVRVGKASQTEVSLRVFHFT